MEKEKNIIRMEIYYMKGIIPKEKKMEKEKCTHMDGDQN